MEVEDEVEKQNNVLEMVYNTSEVEMVANQKEDIVEVVFNQQAEGERLKSMVQKK